MKDKSVLLSIIVVYNDIVKLNTLLHSSLSKQEYSNYELVLVDNRNGQYNSASKAYNAGADKAVGDYFLYLLNAGVYDLLGFAGADSDSEGKVKYINGMLPFQNNNYIRIFDHSSCFTCDECGFILKKNLFNLYRLSDLGETWHLYAVDLCLRLKIDKLKIGVIRVDVIHHSNGDRNKSFFKTFRQLVVKYNSFFSHLYTTCYDTTTVITVATIKLLLRQFTPIFIKKIRRKILNLVRN